MIPLIHRQFITLFRDDEFIIIGDDLGSLHLVTTGAEMLYRVDQGRPRMVRLPDELSSANIQVLVAQPQTTSQFEGWSVANEAALSMRVNPVLLTTERGKWVYIVHAGWLDELKMWLVVGDVVRCEILNHA
jgi:hypothetical protein